MDSRFASIVHRITAHLVANYNRTFLLDGRLGQN